MSQKLTYGIGCCARYPHNTPFASSTTQQHSLFHPLSTLHCAAMSSTTFFADAVLFDMDSTLTNSISAVEAAWNKVAEDIGQDPAFVIASTHGKRHSVPSTTSPNSGLMSRPTSCMLKSRPLRSLSSTTLMPTTRMGPVQGETRRVSTLSCHPLSSTPAPRPTASYIPLQPLRLAATRPQRLILSVSLPSHRA